MKKFLAVLLAVLAVATMMVACGEKKEGDNADAIAAAEYFDGEMSALAEQTGGMMKASAKASGDSVIITMEIASEMMDMVEESGQSKDDLAEALESEFAAGSPFESPEADDYPGVKTIKMIIKVEGGETLVEKVYNR